jgi:DNA processing protein
LNFTTQHQQIALTLLSGIGSKRARLLIHHFSSLDEFFSEKKLNIAKIPGVSPNFISFKQRVEALIAAEAVLNKVLKSQGSIVFFTDSAYPKRLKQCEDAPLLLYTQGVISWNTEKIISIVGTRNITEYGKRITHELIEGLAPHQPIIVSGMAYGVDICAHNHAIRNNLSTWGVLGHGIDLMYPSEHRKTAQKMLENGGLISEFYPGLKAEPGHFPMRNRIVAGISDATIVVESGEKGGSLITATLANDYNRDVYAFPGDVDKPYSAGCNNLIQQHKAQLITSSNSLIKALGWDQSAQNKSKQCVLFDELNVCEEKIITALRTKNELTMDAIGYLSGLPIGTVSSELLALEFKGLIRSLPGKRYRLIQSS